VGDVLIRAFALLAGLAVGSFLNVCVSRWPADLSVISPPSRCARCERPIRPWENIPVLSWLMLRGRCAGCGAPISIQYPAVELLVGLIWLASVWTYGPGLTALRVAVFVTVLAGVALTDAQHYEIPDGFTLFGLAWVLATALGGAFRPEASPFAAPYDALIGACAGAGAIAIAGWLGEVTLGREAMGFGDVTLMAVVGAAVGAERALLTIFLGAAIGLVVFILVVLPITRVRRVRAAAVSGPADNAGALPPVPFGVFLAPGAVLALLLGGDMIRWYTFHLLVP